MSDNSKSILEELLRLEHQPDGTRKVGSRERRDLEFKETFDAHTLRLSLKTIAAFANTGGGTIIFGVTDHNRRLCGIDSAAFDEAQIDDLVSAHLVPAPDVACEETDLAGYRLCLLRVAKMAAPPTVPTKDVQTKEAKNRTVLNQGVVYYRRSGK